MIRKYIIDGNNIIGKISRLQRTRKTDPQAARDHLTAIIDRYFSIKKVEVSLHFDGFKHEGLQSSTAKIKYSNNRPADLLIKEEIEKSKNRKQICVISSDHEILNYAKICGCKTIKSEVFTRNLFPKSKEKSEEELTKEIDNDEIKRAFGLD